MLNDTICAISTALKEGAISIVRMSGDESFEIIRKISDVKTIKPNTIVYSHIRDEGEIIDEVLISFFVQGSPIRWKTWWRSTAMAASMSPGSSSISF